MDEQKKDQKILSWKIEAEINKLKKENENLRNMNSTFSKIKMDYVGLLTKVSIKENLIVFLKIEKGSNRK